MKLIKRILASLSPLLLFAVLFVPYHWVNSEYIVEWLGCGCNSGFNANDFTAIFWSLITVCSTAISVRVSKEMGWFKVLYVPFIVAASCFIAYRFYSLMLWL